MFACTLEMVRLALACPGLPCLTLPSAASCEPATQRTEDEGFPSVNSRKPFTERRNRAPPPNTVIAGVVMDGARGKVLWASERRDADEKRRVEELWEWWEWWSGVGRGAVTRV
ncbi:hypothetical protein E2C01_085707 [Portunus trituberculatus]|uniref:Uncharacterized protein n=1 Tax=Portunus trituberculatus TaxID=210409 RepID=A0A5B7J1R0_PORTR|nr:hypothetical protein [Portunus trituberculatus]